MVKNQGPMLRFSLVSHSWKKKLNFQVVFRFLADGRSNTSRTPAAFCLKNFVFWALSWPHAESKEVVSWSTRWVYLVRPERPKFLTWGKDRWWVILPNVMYQPSIHYFSLMVRSTIPAWLWEEWFCWNDPPGLVRWNLSCILLHLHPAEKTVLAILWLY